MPQEEDSNTNNRLLQSKYANDHLKYTTLDLEAAGPQQYLSGSECWLKFLQLQTRL